MHSGYRWPKPSSNIAKQLPENKKELVILTQRLVEEPFEGSGGGGAYQFMRAEETADLQASSH